MTALLQDYLNDSPHRLFDEWFASAAAGEGQDVNAMSLATVDAAGMPQLRTVLLKAHSGGEFVFYTNSESRKGQALKSHPRAALLFFWRAQRRQVSVEGHVRQLSGEESAPYYHSRPRASRIGAWASAQSRPLESVRVLQERMAEKTAEFDGREPPIPPYWRGFCLRPARIEFWQEGEHRLHQRLAFVRGEGGGWRGELLQP